MHAALAAALDERLEVLLTPAERTANCASPAPPARARDAASRRSGRVLRLGCVSVVLLVGLLGVRAMMMMVMMCVMMRVRQRRLRGEGGRHGKSAEGGLQFRDVHERVLLCWVDVLAPRKVKRARSGSDRQEVSELANPGGPTL